MQHTRRCYNRNAGKYVRTKERNANTFMGNDRNGIKISCKGIWNQHPRRERRGIKASARISGCIVVADAMNCQIETAKAVLEAKADYLLCAKSNQQILKADIEEYVQDDKLRAKMNSV